MGVTNWTQRFNCLMHHDMSPVRGNSVATSRSVGENRERVALRLTPLAQGILPERGSPSANLRFAEGESQVSRMAVRQGFEFD